MAKFRPNHSRSNSKAKTYVVSIILFCIVLIFLIRGLHHFQKKIVLITEHSDATEDKRFELNEVDLPSVTGDNLVIEHRFYSLSYSEHDEQAEWVAYILTRDQLNSSKHERHDYFTPDPAIKSQSATHRDFTGSGYTRGHLAPAADMAFDAKAGEESFYMSNISPQLLAFNAGIWRELEENVRDWARMDGKIHVVTGPVLSKGINNKIGKNRVSVPTMFYKVLLDLDEPIQKGIGFLIPNTRSEISLRHYMVSIDSVERVTGIDFFNSNQPKERIETLEKSYQAELWKLNEYRFKKRVQEWNRKG